MSRMRIPRVAVLLLALGTLTGTVSAAAAGAGALGKLQPAVTPVDLLAGRLRVRVPAGARNEARGHSIMAAPESAQQETRLVLDAGRERLVMMTYELFATAGNDLAAAVRRDLADGPAPQAVEALALPGLRAVTVVPAVLDLKREAILILGVYVALPDATVQSLAFFVNPSGAADLPGATALARRIAATLTAGPARLASLAGPRLLSDGLSLTVPAGYIATNQEGPDFVVHHLRKLSPLGQPAARLGLYVGGHPSYQHRQVDEPPAALKQTPGKLLGRDIEWHSWTRGRDPVQARTMEAILPLSGSGVDPGLLLHVFLTAATDAELADLRQIAESLTAKPAH